MGDGVKSRTSVTNTGALFHTEYICIPDISLSTRLSPSIKEESSRRGGKFASIQIPDLRANKRPASRQVQISTNVSICFVIRHNPRPSQHMFPSRGTLF